MSKLKNIVFYGTVGVLVFGASIFSQVGTTVDSTIAQSAAVYQSVQQPVQKPQPTADLSNDNYYTNSIGNKVHSPAYVEDGSVPVGASARCSDGTYSFSQSNRGTCSHHGGVVKWLN
ncbi:MAG TPA: DUF3761 domain-containing protein [Candidatus Paceibacterota bacterium]|nr:DUF3761 domain-containing protein [Candidatus Paceibacterota bacterium]